MQYDMESWLALEAEAIPPIMAHLQQQSSTVRVIDVRNTPDYRKKDVDLLWITKISGDGGDNAVGVTIEVKGDNRGHETGNFFFETRSNAEHYTLGCFMYTEADWVYYYFLKNKTLYKLPMPATRDWFREQIQDFQERSTITPCNPPQGNYTMTGRLVPIKVLEASGISYQKEILK